MFAAPGVPRPGSALLAERIESFPKGEVIKRQKAAEAALLQLGITFTVYGDDRGTERIFPFDISPRIIEAQDWEIIERGLRQRVHP